ncbi:DUF2087 domain-containing protein [Streptomyces sp. NPDC094143]|uniref:DUF2087 domain-containing protein n=1 Tax=Streptomyces sp. NPDC094143 TaxID=3155310 RepID=UPI00331A5C08
MVRLTPPPGPRGGRTEPPGRAVCPRASGSACRPGCGSGTRLTVNDVWRHAAPRRPRPRPQASIPSKQGKRRTFLEGLVPLFALQRRYPETEVNDILREVHPDVAAPRRYLVEERLLMRADGQYWRP